MLFVVKAYNAGRPVEGTYGELRGAHKRFFTFREDAEEVAKKLQKDISRYSLPDTFTYVVEEGMKPKVNHGNIDLSLDVTQESVTIRLSRKDTTQDAGLVPCTRGMSERKP